LHDLRVLDDETIKWLLKPALRSSAAKQWIAASGSNDEEATKMTKANRSQFISQGN